MRYSIGGWAYKPKTPAQDNSGFLWYIQAKFTKYAYISVIATRVINRLCCTV
jgi:hypothetical protein